MPNADDCARAKALLWHGAPATGAPLVEQINTLRRSRSDRWVARVCGGLAQATGLASWAWRLGLVGLMPFGSAGPPTYVLRWIFVPALEACIRVGSA